MTISWYFFVFERVKVRKKNGLRNAGNGYLDPAFQEKTGRPAPVVKDPGLSELTN